MEAVRAKSDRKRGCEGVMIGLGREGRSAEGKGRKEEVGDLVELGRV